MANEASKLDDLRKTLQAELDRLRAERADLQQRTNALDDQLGKLSAGLAGLDGRAGKPSVGTRRRAAGMTAAEVEPIVAAVLRERGPLGEEEILQGVVAAAHQQGRTASGLHLLLRRTLAAGAFFRTPQGWQIAAVGTDKAGDAGSPRV